MGTGDRIARVHTIEVPTGTRRHGPRRRPHLIPRDALLRVMGTRGSPLALRDGAIAALVFAGLGPAQIARVECGHVCVPARRTAPSSRRRSPSDGAVKIAFATFCRAPRAMPCTPGMRSGKGPRPTDPWLVLVSPRTGALLRSALHPGFVSRVLRGWAVRDH